MKPEVTAETNLNGKKKRQSRKILSVDEIVEMSKSMHLTTVAQLSDKINAERERRVKEIRELLNSVEK